MLIGKMIFTISLAHCELTVVPPDIGTLDLSGVDNMLRAIVIGATSAV